MRQIRDTFLHLLADNLVGITVHNLRRDPNYPDSDNIKGNAVNVQFTNANYDNRESTLVAHVDIVHESELTATDWMQSVWAILGNNLMAPLLDYSVTPTSPTDTGQNIYWTQPVKFRPIADDFYFRYSCTLTLSTHLS